MRRFVTSLVAAPPRPGTGTFVRQALVCLAALGLAALVGHRLQSLDIDQVRRAFALIHPAQ